MKKLVAAATAAAAVCAMATLSGVAFAGDHGSKHDQGQGQKPGSAQQGSSSSSDQQAGVKPSHDTYKDQTCTTGGGQGSSATCQSGTYPGKADSSKRYGNGKTAAQIANGKGAPAGTPVYGPGNSQPHKICGRDVHAYKGGDCGKQNGQKPPKSQPQSQQTVTFCDMDTATTGKLETKNASEVANHEFNGNPEENRDIVPPFTLNGTSYSENWPSGEAIFNAGCNSSTPTPPPTSTQPAPQTVTFCDMDSATSGKLETKSSVELLNHEFNGTPEEARDIVPPFTFSGPTFTTKDNRTYVAGQSYSQLWNATTEAIFDNGCTAPTPPPAAATPATLVPAAQTPAAATPAAPAPAASAQVAAPAATPAAAAAPSAVLGASKALKAPTASSPAHAPAGVLGAAKTLGTTATSGTLPFTGLRLWIVELIALGLIGAGVATRLIARRRPN
jgi:hypothetical protein